AEVLKKISLALKSMGFTRMFMGMAVAKLSNHRLTISAGGMPFALVNRIETGKTDQVVLKAPPLGSFPDFQYEQKVVALKPGDTVLFLSDGLEETFNNREQMLGERRVRKLFTEMADEKPRKVVDHLANAAKSWANGETQRDDMTILAIKMK
ncbi:serine/threonine-protein phosphatase, partial [candidate division KSB1 bacterium]|nr:serine/threonine-protein phosphatase [candidate division KSB1 bacterium]